MQVTFACRACERVSRARVPAADTTVGAGAERDAKRPEGAPQLACHHCGESYGVPDDVSRGGTLKACLICGCQELFVRKDFSQRIGVSIVVAGFIASSIAWAYHMRYTTYGILFATALIDVILYAAVGNLLQCYRCQAEYRHLNGLEAFDPFNLETHERFRQQAARLAEGEPPP